jgi:hypothetical protein
LFNFYRLNICDEIKLNDTDLFEEELIYSSKSNNDCNNISTKKISFAHFSNIFNENTDDEVSYKESILM